MMWRWRQLFTPPTAAAAAVLLVGVLGLQTATAKLGVILRKQPVPLRQELDLVSEKFGSYELLMAEGMSHDMENSLGTKQYISWVFRDKSLNPDEPGAAVRLHVAYYTGTADTIPHVPELCYVASGVEALDSRQIEIRLNLNGAAGEDVTAPTAGGQTVTVPNSTVPMHLFTFRARSDQDPISVFYFFVANGHLFGSKQGVRMSAINIRDRYAYYCKIELMPGRLQPHPETGRLTFAGGVSEQPKAILAVEKFLSAAFPEILLCLPDWKDVRAGRYPETR